mmetsp:Transcript_4747/g.7165  ORF Transcript_4747/g.7165 Transcript_4747/m.7165 type:complete len:104 (+) Transcript_4747:1311-1622(+)
MGTKAAHALHDGPCDCGNEDNLHYGHCERVQKLKPYMMKPEEKSFNFEESISDNADFFNDADFLLQEDSFTRNDIVLCCCKNGLQTLNHDESMKFVLLGSPEA